MGLSSLLSNPTGLLSGPQDKIREVWVRSERSSSSSSSAKSVERQGCPHSSQKSTNHTATKAQSLLSTDSPISPIRAYAGKAVGSIADVVKGNQKQSPRPKIGLGSRHERRVSLTPSTKSAAWMMDVDEDVEAERIEEREKGFRRGYW